MILLPSEIYVRSLIQNVTSIVATGNKIDGSTIEVVLAKPVDKQDYQRFTRSEQMKTMPGLAGVPTFVSHLHLFTLLLTCSLSTDVLKTNSPKSLKSSKEFKVGGQSY